MRQITIDQPLKSGLAHCCHHDKHWEYCFDFTERVQFIKDFKPEREQELRLRLFRIVPDALLPGEDSPEWEAYQKAGEAYRKAWQASLKAGEAYQRAGEAYRKAWEAYQKAGEAYQRAWEACQRAWEAYLKVYVPELDELHKNLFPDCPWNGKTIFTET